MGNRSACVDVVKAFLRFLGNNAKWWLTPILLVFLLLLGMVILASTSTTPLMYSY